ncbi:MAG TPA: hypothetical protein VMV48_14690 [Gallionellaceae bacterium]|nr:hypothetical protein [Gallionellaceae bacterium]
MQNQNISDEYLNSFVDNQLDPAEKAQAFDAINRNVSMRERVCELRGLKELIQHSYSQPPLYMLPSAKQLHRWSGHFHAIAACLILLIGGVSGWLTHAWISRERGPDLMSIVDARQAGYNLAESRKIIVHVSNSDPVRLKAALDETEDLLDTYRRANRQINIEVIANKHAVDLLRSNVSAYAPRINAMQQKYPNLNFLVCGQTISKLKAKGENVQLLPHTGIASSAAEQINKRMQQGWGYVRI